jgi:hypothetical protein
MLKGMKNLRGNKENVPANGFNGSQGSTLVTPMNEQNGHYGPALQEHNGGHQLPQGYPPSPAVQFPFPFPFPLLIHMQKMNVGPIKIMPPGQVF